jgi:superfamily I DNA/RNA helicase
MLSSISTEIGKIEYLMLSDINNEVRKELASNNIFSYTKNKTDVFSTSSNRAGLTSEFMRILNLKYPEYNPNALYRAATVKILEEGVDSYLRRTKIELSDRDYSELANQFCRKKEGGIFVEAIHKIKGMEGDTACFIICNSLLEVLLGVKNDYNRETNLLYVALTRTKRRLLLIVDDNQGLIENFEKQKIDIHTGMKELDIVKAEIGDWF